jgi:hypothetical protein
MARRLPPCTFDTLREIASKLPGVEEGTAWGVPAFKVRGRLLACIATNKAAEPNTLVVCLGFDQRDAMIADAPEIYYLKAHYAAYPSILVRLSRIDRAALEDLLHASWRFVNASARKPKRPARSRKP